VGGPFETWLELRERVGDSVGVRQLYELAGQERGLRGCELPREERFELVRRALPVLYPGHQSTADSGRFDPIEVVPYDEKWPATFARWRTVLVEALGPIASRIEHVGSTAVPRLAAKPVVDIQVSVEDQLREEEYAPKIESVGVQLRSRDNEHRYFRPFPGRPRDVHVHVCSASSNWERAHLLFRDYLRQDQAARDEYAAVKLRAAEVWSDDRMAYTEAKDDVIRRTLSQAETWARDVGWTVDCVQSRI
jgi:GrpB-like predicted nucleotidyltransferase (UPF0157 family)